MGRTPVSRLLDKLIAETALVFAYMVYNIRNCYIMKNLPFIFVFCLATGFLGLQRAVAQAAGPPAFQLPASAQLPAPVALPSANAADRASTTNVVRIYSGPGYFDAALAERLRPMLAKGFALSKPERLKSVPAEPLAAPATPDSQKKVAQTPRL